MTKKRTYIYRLFERFWHWNQALLILFLALTGFEIHGTLSLFGFENVVKWHDAAAWAFLVLIIFAIFWHFATGEWKQYIPTTRFIKAQVSYYITGIFRGAEHPTHKTAYNKFNPLQRLIYLGLKLLVIPVQVVTGFLYMFYNYPENPFHHSGLNFIALMHTLGAFTLLAFVVAHVYLTTTGDTPFSAIKAMITGWEEVDVDEKEEHLQHMPRAVDNSVAGYYRLNREGLFIDVNEAWLRMYKYTGKEQVLGKHFSISRDPCALPQLANLVDEVLKGKTIKSRLAIRKCSDGSLAKHLLSANPYEVGGRIEGMEGFILDVDEVTNLS
jgi:PAS domain S-box-containing protein